MDKVFDIRFDVVFRIVIKTKIHVQLITFHCPESEYQQITVSIDYRKREQYLFMDFFENESTINVFQITEAPFLFLNEQLLYNAHKSFQAFISHHS